MRAIRNVTKRKITDYHLFKRVPNKIIKIYSTSFTIFSHIVGDVTAYERVAHIVHAPSLISTIREIIDSCRNNRATFVVDCFILLRTGIKFNVKNTY